jgi:hypothetical protein
MAARSEFAVVRALFKTDGGGGEEHFIEMIIVKPRIELIPEGVVEAVS